MSRSLARLRVAAALLVPLAATPGLAQESREQLNEDLVRRYVEEVLSPGEFSRLDEFLAADYLWSLGPPGADAPRGPDSVRAGDRLRRSVFPDLSYTVDELVAAAGTIVARVTVSGTHTGKGGGVEPTGNALELTEVLFFRLADGRIRQAGSVANLLALSQAMGFTLTPPAAEGGR